jgi:hypothetical protein
VKHAEHFHGGEALIDRGRNVPKVLGELGERPELRDAIGRLRLDEARALLDVVEARRRAERIEPGDVAELDELLDLVESLSPAELFELFNDPRRPMDLDRERA